LAYQKSLHENDTQLSHYAFSSQKYNFKFHVTFFMQENDF
jgi:hypothetical protein